jgi:5-methylcytosine-specific restriction protein A
MPLRSCNGCGKLSTKPRCPSCQLPRGPSSRVTGRRDWREVLKPEIIKRDKGICWLCKQPGADSVDHVKAVAHGGTNDPANLKAAHLVCNQRRGTLMTGVAETIPVES